MRLLNREAEANEFVRRSWPLRLSTLTIKRRTLSIVSARIRVRNRRRRRDLLEVRIREAMFARPFETEAMVPGVRRKLFGHMLRIRPIQPGSNLSAARSLHINFGFEVATPETFEAVEAFLVRDIECIDRSPYQVIDGSG